MSLEQMNNMLSDSTLFFCISLRKIVFSSYWVSLIVNLVIQSFQFCSFSPEIQLYLHLLCVPQKLQRSTTLLRFELLWIFLAYKMLSARYHPIGCFIFCHSRQTLILGNKPLYLCYGDISVVPLILFWIVLFIYRLLLLSAFHSPIHLPTEDFG